MTENEAISRIKDHMEIHRLKEPRAIYITVALSMAITALKEIQQYREIGTAEEFREAVEKQKPKVGIVTAGKSYPIMCPSCGHKMGLAYHHCIFCGQSLIYLQKHEQSGDQMDE